MDMTPTESTKRGLEGALGSLVSYLEFTVESGDDFPTWWMLTLDLDIKVNR